MHTDNSLKKLLSFRYFHPIGLTIILPSLREDPLVWNQCKDRVSCMCRNLAWIKICPCGHREIWH